MPSAQKLVSWRVRVNAKITRAVAPGPQARRLAAMFALGRGRTETLYHDFALDFASGQIVAVVGPSGAGKTVLLRQIARQVGQAQWLDLRPRRFGDRAPAAVLRGGELGERLAMLSRCGLAEAAVLAAPARHMSGGESYRLALAAALHAAARRGRPGVVIADEFAACLDPVTAAVLCRTIRRFVSSCGLLAVVLATPRPELVPVLRPDAVVVKPLGRPAELLRPDWRRRRVPAVWNVRRWPILRGRLGDYHAMASYHYVGRPPAAHKRVYVVRPPRGLSRRGWLAAGAGDPAAVLVVSPPLANVRGRNIATGGRYAGGDRAAALRMLNREIECISRVIVHPMYRSCGLAVRLVRHALATAETPLMEALASMGAVHPFLERAGMRAWPVPPEPRRSRRRPGGRPYVYYLAATALARRGPRGGWSGNEITKRTHLSNWQSASASIGAEAF